MLRDGQIQKTSISIDGKYIYQNVLIFLVYMISIIFYTSKLFLQIKKLQSTKLEEARVKLF